MRFINIGFGNVVAAQRILAVLSPDSAPIKRMIQEAKERGMLVAGQRNFGEMSDRCLIFMRIFMCAEKANPCMHRKKMLHI